MLWQQNVAVSFELWSRIDWQKRLGIWETWEDECELLAEVDKKINSHINPVFNGFYNFCCLHTLFAVKIISIGNTVFTLVWSCSFNELKLTIISKILSDLPLLAKLAEEWEKSRRNGTSLPSGSL